MHLLSSAAAGNLVCRALCIAFSSPLHRCW
ncbi:hypothetical protein ES332_A05G307500v1 [Gossypium tomentosum]|uniref:Uncharacterized protein n=1 Tax=Gossypium tomentosum TaxID=34277 RepID=A0A5D2QL33_GOSTO|nr:hypothetical protein ES332_A05G307500v1 [Gossypium tomentosum]